MFGNKIFATKTSSVIFFAFAGNKIIHLENRFRWVQGKGCALSAHFSADQNYGFKHCLIKEKPQGHHLDHKKIC